MTLPVHRDLPPGGGRPGHGRRRSVSYRFEAFDNVEPDRGLDVESEVTGTLDQPRRRGDLHLHGLDRPADPVQRPEPGSSSSPRSTTRKASRLQLVPPEQRRSLHPDHAGYLQAGPHHQRPERGQLRLPAAGPGIVGQVPGEHDRGRPDRQPLGAGHAAGAGPVQHRPTARPPRPAATTSRHPGWLLFQPGQTAATVEVQAIDKLTARRATLTSTCPIRSAPRSRRAGGRAWSRSIPTPRGRSTARSSTTSTATGRSTAASPGWPAGPSTCSILERRRRHGHDRLHRQLLVHRRRRRVVHGRRGRPDGIRPDRPGRLRAPTP